MKTCLSVRRLFEFEDGLYTMEPPQKPFSVGTKLYDSRKATFIELETEEDCIYYAFVAPELLGLMIPYPQKLD